MQNTVFIQNYEKLMATIQKYIVEIPKIVIMKTFKTGFFRGNKAVYAPPSASPKDRKASSSPKKVEERLRLIAIGFFSLDKSPIEQKYPTKSRRVEI